MLWSKNMQLIDANVILRYLLNDNRDMSQKAREVGSAIINAGDVSNLDTPGSLY